MNKDTQPAKTFVNEEERQEIMDEINAAIQN